MSLTGKTKSNVRFCIFFMPWFIAAQCSVYNVSSSVNVNISKNVNQSKMICFFVICVGTFVLFAALLYVCFLSQFIQLKLIFSAIYVFFFFYLEDHVSSDGNHPVHVIWTCLENYTFLHRNIYHMHFGKMYKIQFLKVRGLGSSFSRESAPKEYQNISFKNL